MTLSIFLAKLSKIEKVFLVSKIIILSEKLSDNKCNTFSYFDLNYYFIYKNMSLNYVLAM